MFGVIAGVSGVVVVIALGNGANRELQQALGSLGTGSVIIRSVDSQASPIPESVAEDIRTILAPYIPIFTWTVSRGYPVSSDRGGSSSYQVIGTTRSYAELFNLDLHAGRFLTDYDQHQRRRVCVLGWEAAKALFPRGQVVGQSVRIGREWYTVVGWLKATASSMPKLESLNLKDAEHRIYVPFDSLYGPHDQGTIDEITARFPGEAELFAGLEALSHLIEFRAGERPQIILPMKLLREKRKVQQMFQYALLGVAGLVLAIGGIGITNMMMVNVISRKQEIGLRRAIGATRRDILEQFLSESLTISVLGGISGVILGAAVAALLNMLSDWLLLFSPMAAVTGVVVSVILGTVFGSYPASQAAAVSPALSLTQQ